MIPFLLTVWVPFVMFMWVFDIRFVVYVGLSSARPLTV